MGLATPGPRLDGFFAVSWLVLDTAVPQLPAAVVVAVRQLPKTQPISLVRSCQPSATALVRSPHPAVISETTIPGALARSETIDPSSISLKTLAASVTTDSAGQGFQSAGKWRYDKVVETTHNLLRKICDEVWDLTMFQLGDEVLSSIRVVFEGLNNIARYLACLFQKFVGP